MKLGDKVYGGTLLCQKMSHVGPLGGAQPPKNMHFGGVFRVIFKNYLLPQFCSDFGSACGFANFRAISKSSRSRIVQFRPSFGFMGLGSWLLEVFRMTDDVTSM